MLSVVLMGTKRQFKMYLSDDLLERLENAAEKIGKRSGQEVAEEILTIYLPVWTNVNDSMNRAVTYQINKVSEEIITSKKLTESESSKAVAKKSSGEKKKLNKATERMYKNAGEATSIEELSKKK